MPASTPPLDWLLDTGDAWVQYRTRRDLLGQPEDDPDVQTARAAMLADPRVEAMIAALQDWPGPPLNNHKKAGHHLHRLSFLAEIGLRADDPGMGVIVERALAHQADEGAFQIVFDFKRGSAGTDGPTLSWMLCDAPLVLWILCKLGAGNDARVQQAAAYLVAQVRENGWPCTTGLAAGFRGPGRKDDPCPYATLLALKALAAYDGDLAPPSPSCPQGTPPCPQNEGRGASGEPFPLPPRGGGDRPQVGGWGPRTEQVNRYAGKDQAIQAGIEALLWHWEIQAERKLYLFGIGTDFRKPKLPLVWYDILHVLDVLSQYETARRDTRYGEMRAALLDQADAAGRFTAGSMYRDWQDWAFADKKHPSPGITLIAWRAALRGP